MPLVDGCLANWAAADAELPAPGLVLADGVTRAAFVGMRAQLAEAQRVVTVAENAVAFTATVLGQLRPKLALRLEQFNDTVRVWWRGQPMADALPAAPHPTGTLDKFLLPMRQVLRLWEVINTRPAPAGVVLPLRLGTATDFARADLAALVAEADVQAAALVVADVNLALARAERNALERKLRSILVGYAQAVMARFGAKSHITMSVPRITPIPGHTPKPVPLTGQYDASASAALLTWEESLDPKIASYQIRACAGKTYKKPHERVQATLPKDAPRQALIPQPPFGTTSYKVYVLLDTGNERGSATVVVTGPSTSLICPSKPCRFGSPVS